MFARIRGDAIVVDHHDDAGTWILDFGFDLGMDGVDPGKRAEELYWSFNWQTGPSGNRRPDVIPCRSTMCVSPSRLGAPHGRLRTMGVKQGEVTRRRAIRLVFSIAIGLLGEGAAHAATLQWEGTLSLELLAGNPSFHVEGGGSPA